MITRRAAVLLTLVLAACSSDPGSPMLAYVAASPPTQKAIVASANAAATEAKLAAPQQISDVRPSDHGPGQYFVCLKEANPPSGGLPRYYSVFFDNDVYKGERLSVMIDECEKQTFTLLPPVPTEPAVPAPTEPANAKPAKHKRDRGSIQ
jgi:hypothetical protein